MVRRLFFIVAVFSVTFAAMLARTLPASARTETVRPVAASLATAPAAWPPPVLATAGTTMTAADFLRPHLAPRSHAMTFSVNEPGTGDYCYESNTPGWSPGQPVKYFCYLPDTGASNTIRVVVSPDAQYPYHNVQGVWCNSTTWAWQYTSGSPPDPSLNVSLSPSTTGAQFDSCSRTEGPITFTVTRVSAPAQVRTDYQVYGNFSFCTTYSGCGNASESAIFLTVFQGGSLTGPGPERPCGRCNGTTIGDPIDIATGELYDQRTDLKLSGPFGLTFTRFYSSQFPGTTDLGGGNWTHNYAAHLDVTSTVSGLATYYDAQQMPYYFSGLHAGGSAYDGGTGMTLARSADGNTYTLTSFSGAVSTFNANGELTSLRDRIGNTQTIARDTTSGHGDRIVSVTDALGRNLCFYYDAASRITAVAGLMQTTACPSTAPASSATTPVVSLGYNSATNCPLTFLCSVTEPDGGTWSYQYADTTTPTNLTKVLDPLGDPVSINTYSGNKVVHHESGSCSGSSPCADTGGYINITYPSSGSTVTVTDGLGRTSTLTYDPTSLLLTSIVGPICGCGGDQTRIFTWDTYGRQLSVSDDGIDGTTKHTLTYAYGRDGSVVYPGPTSITENVASGTTRTITRAYYPIGDPRQDLVQSTTLPSVDSPGNTMTIANTYSTTGLLTQRTTTGYVNGVSTSYTRGWTYDSRGRVLTANGPRTDVSQTTTYAYFTDTDSDAARAGQLHTVTDALGHVTTYGGASGFTSYSPFGGAQSVTDANGVTTEFAFDNVGRPVTKTVLPSAEGELSMVTQTTYDAAGRRTKLVLPKGNGISYGYDTSSRPTQVVRFDAQLLQHERATVAYNAFDQPTSFSTQACTAPATACSAWSTAYSRTYGYSSTTSDLTQITNADSTSKSATYIAQGAVATMNDENHPTGTNYKQTYDLAGRILSESRMLAGSLVATSYVHDLHDNITSVSDPNGNVTTYHYDDFDRMTKETSPVSGVTTFAYDAAGNLTSTTNANGTVESFTYDALDRVLTENDVKGSATASETWTYDDPTAGHNGIGRTATVTDPSGSAGYTYDRLGNLEVVNKNVNGTTYTTGYFYDLNNDRSSLTYPDGTVVSFAYDFADRPYSASQVGPPDQLSITRRTMSKASTIAALRARSLPAPYHSARPETVTKTNRSPAIVPPHGRVSTPPRFNPESSARTTGGGAPVITPSDANRRVASRASSTLVSSATYAPFGPLTSLAFGNGTTQTITYNQRFLPTENKLVTGATTLADHLYTEDSVGNITGITDGLDAGYNRSYGYDDLNRLTTANTGAKLWGTASGNGQSYDAMGNIKSMTLGTSTALTFSYQPGGSGSTGLPLMQSLTINGASFAVTNDAIGAMTTGGGTSAWTYGARELLATNTPGNVSYMYDGLRQRVQSQLSDGTQRISIFDGEQHLISESVLSTSPSTIAYDYVWFGDRSVAQLDATTTHWTYGDQLGTPLVQTDANAAVTWQAEYQPFGKVFALRAGDVHQPLRAPGQTAEQFDTGANGQTILDYNNARWYRPGIGRYTQADPLGVVSSPRAFGFRHARVLSRMQIVRADADPTATNVYAYAEDDPNAFVDPTGLLPIPTWGNYCGPGYTNGMNVVSESNVRPEDIGPAGKGPAPTDALDGCCVDHDRCHSSCAHGNPCKITPCKNNCDWTLSVCSAGVSDIGSHGLIHGAGEWVYGSAVTDIFMIAPVMRDIGWWHW
jgi:RHS repeat-associated protein